ncbi:MAG: uroporphyrinogen decarboxylase family protein [Desulfobacteraceae bacterium]
MAAHLTEKENFLRVARGKIPEYVPVVRKKSINDPPLMAICDPVIIGDFRGPGGGFDPWGVPFIVSEAAEFTAMPKPSDFILTDITKWRDVIKAPDYSGFDWEAAANADWKKYIKYPDVTSLTIAGFGDLFQQFIGMMGFTQGLMAIYEEREEVEALFDYMLEVSLYITKNLIHYYKPDGYYLLDDTATQMNSFISPQLFDELLVPRYKKCLDIAREADIPIFYHNCGKCENLMPSMVEIGVNVWDPAQTMNDLPAMKKKYGRKLAINGGFELDMPSTWPDFDEEEVRNAVRETFDKLAPDGGFMFNGGIKSLDFTDPDVQKINAVITDEAEKLSTQYYK